MYLESKHTRIMSCVFMDEDTQEITTWLPHGQYAIPGCHTGSILPPSVIKMLATHVFTAHNGEFFDELVWKRFKLPLPSQGFLDTMHLCRMAGLPGGLDKAMQAVGLPAKSSGTAMKMLTEAKIKDGMCIYPVGPRTVWEKMLSYNRDDVTGLYQLYQKVLALLGGKYPYGFLAAHRAINARGLLVDRVYLDQLIELWKQCKLEAVDEIYELTNGKLNASNINSPVQVKKWLQSLGINTDSVSVKEINNIIQNPEDYTNDPDEATFAISILQRRQDAVRATVGKLDRILREMEPDGHVRNSIVAFGAHTGRRSGRGVQVHNFPRGIDYKGTLGRVITYEDIDAIVKNNTTRIKHSDVLTTLTRQVFIPESGYKYCILDYAAIEARGTAYVSNCKSALAIFADNHADIYKTMAAKVFGCLESEVTKEQRFIGKQMVLGLGYQMGDKKFALTCKTFNINLESLGITAKQCVDIFRDTFPEIKNMWKELDNAAILACCNLGKVYTAGLFNLYAEQGRLRLQLPSGREIIYRDAAVFPKMTPWGQLKSSVCYTNPHGMQKWLYGGILLENGVQGMSADFLFEALQTIPLVCLDVHDEVVSLIVEDSEFIANGKKMSKAPKWARNFPLKVAGFIATEYRKGPADKHETEFYRGKVL